MSGAGFVLSASATGAARLSPVLVAAVVGLVFGVPLTLLVVGSLYVHECPIEPGIPVWMIVGGE